MQTFNKILVPVDLSPHCEPIIRLSTNLAKANDAELLFCFVALPPLPPSAAGCQAEMDALIQQERGKFQQIKPTDPNVACKHLFLRGNPGPEILQAVEDHDCDLIILATHGRTGISRWLMGSVAEYVIRHADCPVLTLKTPDHPRKKKRPTPSQESVSSSLPFVTSAMRHAPPIHEFDLMPDVIAELNTASVAAAPVVDNQGACIGILTTTDIERHAQLKKRMRSGDTSILDEVFETDEFGMRRATCETFDQVKRHMSVPAITISAKADCGQAIALLEEHPSIHHLVVVDRDGHPLGIADQQEIKKQIEQATA